jgi:hypothetical protein
VAVSVAGKSELAGVPGGRPKGARKAPVLGCKPVLGAAVTTETSGAAGTHVRR